MISTTASFQADYRTVHLAGAPEALGRTQARLVTDQPAPFRRNPWEDDSDFLRRCGELLRSVHEPLWLELASFAEARGLPAERGMFVRAGALPMGCSTAVWHLPDGTVIAGRNYDFYERMPTRHLLITRPEQGYAHVGMNGGLVGGRYDGVNEHGLFVSLHKVMADRPKSCAAGIPYHLFPRLALELCSSATDAARLFIDLPHLAPFNYLLADTTGSLIKLECYPGMPTGVLPASGAAAATNHYEHPGLVALQGNRPREKSQRRKQALLAASDSSHPWRAMGEALSDHASDLCSHREYSTTLWSGLFDLTWRRVAYAFGPPCTTPYRDVPWPAAAAGGTRNA